MVVSSKTDTRLSSFGWEAEWLDQDDLEKRFAGKPEQLKATRSIVVRSSSACRPFVVAVVVFVGVVVAIVVVVVVFVMAVVVVRQR